MSVRKCDMEAAILQLNWICDFSASWQTGYEGPLGNHRGMQVQAQQEKAQLSSFPKYLRSSLIKCFQSFSFLQIISAQLEAIVLWGDSSLWQRTVQLRRNVYSVGSTGSCEANCGTRVWLHTGTWAEFIFIYWMKFKLRIKDPSSLIIRAVVYISLQLQLRISLTFTLANVLC